MKHEELLQELDTLADTLQHFIEVADPDEADLILLRQRALGIKNRIADEGVTP